MSRFICALLMLSVGATACRQTDDEPTNVSYVAPTTTSTSYRSPAATSTPRVYEIPTAASASPFPTAVPTSAPTARPVRGANTVRGSRNPSAHSDSYR